MSKLTRRFALSDDPFAKMVRKLYRELRFFNLPAPRVLVKPALWLFVATREIYYFIMRVFICEPLFKAYCEKYGRGVRTGPHIHWVQGKGRLIVGDNTKLDGKCSISFAARYVDTPTLVIGSHTNISHNSRFTVGKQISIGSHCRIASDAFIFDASGHASDPEARKAGRPSLDEDVRPISIEDNVWLGRRVTVFPGVIIGEGSIVSAGSVVVGNVAPYTVVAGNPARRIGALKRPDSVSPETLSTESAANELANWRRTSSVIPSNS